jgi:hypothetical protein
VLSEFRTRVAEHGLEEAALDALLARLTADGLLKASGKQRTDSTHVIAAVRGLHTIELAGESVQKALGALAAACPDWLAARLCAGTGPAGTAPESTSGTRRKTVCETSARVAAGTGTNSGVPALTVRADVSHLRKHSVDKHPPLWVIICAG